MNHDEQAMLNYNKKLHKFGRLTTILAYLSMLGVPVILGIGFKLNLEVGPMLVALMGVLSMMIPTTIVEFLSYYPILGASGLYMSFITGNIMNMKLPAAVSNIKAAGYEQGTPEADVISTIAIGVSSLVTMAVLVLGLVIGSAMLPVLQSPVLAPAFANLMPAILGALAVPIFMRDIKTASVPMAVGAILLFVIGRPAYSRISSFLIPVFIVIAVVWSYFLYKRNTKNKEQSAQS